MITKVVVDNVKLKLIRRYLIAASGLLAILEAENLPEKLTPMDVLLSSKPVPRSARAIVKQLVEAYRQLQEAKISIPSNEECCDPGASLKAIRQSMITHEPLPADQIDLAAEEEYKGYDLQVYERLDVDSAQKFQPVVLKDGVPVHQLHYRMTRPYVSFRFAKRAVDCFLATGEWPKKQGVPLGAPAA